ncbi:4Fe-4S dicluster domain-containing protein [Labilibacter marinus]|uniref:4Fe-4S dicluster domain-containing protein n=1 Tax=Labilibacter marinus TaxID=1477105 RepID=UPI0008367B22|nr:reductive dehalogenase domain-containing protein [Labilibacter marinus]
MIPFIFYTLAALKAIFFIWFGIVSMLEKEKRATQISFALAITTPLPFLAASFLPINIGANILLILLALCIIAVVLFFIPLKKIKPTNETSDFQIDERDTMFSRLELTRYPNRSQQYYAENPQHLKLDEQWQKKPGLMNPSSAMYEAKAFAAADASFEVICALRNKVVPPVADNKKNISPEEASAFITKWAKKLGAVDVVFCKLQKQHFYSTRGRGNVYGKAVKNTQQYGIAITVEMNKDYLATGPSAPTLMESAQQYLNSGTIALQLAYFIANMGYSARAHIDGNYEVVCPLVARDAGLGEIGRMGLLMTTGLGPRVRIAVVTTDIPLIPTERKIDTSVDDFCGICKKCADVCPSQAIPKEAKRNINGVQRWQINQEKCFGYWCVSGTDCGRCMSVCPYSHPNNLLHNMVRWGINKSWLFRRVALWLDDFFYGRKPKVKKLDLG